MCAGCRPYWLLYAFDVHRGAQRMQLHNQFALLKDAVALWPVSNTGVVVEPCRASPQLWHEVQTSGDV